MIIGGRIFDFSKAEIEAHMESVAAEPIRQHYAYIAGRRFPPKQVIATVTGWSRPSFGTQRAREALERVGFFCARLDEGAREQIRRSFYQQMVYEEQERRQVDPTRPADERLARAEALLDVLYQEVQRLNRAVADLERIRPG